jgi:hypothetical protein
MKRKYEHKNQVLGLLPAPGWRAYETFAGENGPEVMELPVIGFGIVRRFSRLADSDEDWQTWDGDDAVKPLLYWNEFREAITQSELEDFIDNAVITVVPPNCEYDKERAEAELADKRQRGVKAAA